MEKAPLLVGLLVLFAVGAQADCSIDGSWSKSSYTAGDKLSFSGTIEPHSGFLSGYIENPVGDRVVEVPAQQIDSTYKIEIYTNDSWLNGTYRARFTYVDYANTSNCGETVTSVTELETNNTNSEKIEFEILLTQQMSADTFTYTGAPVDTPYGRIDTVISGTGAKSMPSSFSLMGTKLVPGTGIADMDIQLTLCPTNEEIMTAYRQVSAFLNSSYTDVISYETAISSMREDLNESEDDTIQMRIERDTANDEKKQWMATAAAKWDWWVGILVGGLIGFFLHIFLMRYDQQSRENNYKRPTQKIMKDYDGYGRRIPTHR